MALVLKTPTANSGDERDATEETQVPSLGQEDHLVEGMATNSSVLAWRIPWTEESAWATVHRVAKNQT